MTGKGVFAGLRVVEMAGIGPAPFCAMMLADHGAEVIRIVRPGQTSPLPVAAQYDLCNRGRPSAEFDLRLEQDRAALWTLIEQADVLLEGFRPGTMEKLGFGPDAAAARNPRLVYGRMTGWGQDGPMAGMAGHDLNYAGLTGAVAAIGEADRPPPPPLNLIADFGGGAMLLAFGVAAALYEAQKSGRGQVVDAAMVDGTSLLMSMMFGLNAGGAWGPRSSNLLDGGAPFYACYQTADGGFLAVCPLEPQFYTAFLASLDLQDDPDFVRQYDEANWPRMRQRLTAIFKTRVRDAWAAAFAGTDCCVTPVLSMGEAPAALHNVARSTFQTVEGATHPNPAPRFSRTPAEPAAAVNTARLSATAAVATWNT